MEIKFIGRNHGMVPPSHLDLLDAACTARRVIECEEKAYALAIRNDGPILKNELTLLVAAQIAIGAITTTMSALKITPYESIPLLLSIPLSIGILRMMHVKKHLSSAWMRKNAHSQAADELNTIENSLTSYFSTYQIDN